MPGLAAEAEGEPVQLHRSCPALDNDLLEADESLHLNILLKQKQQVTCSCQLSRSAAGFVIALHALVLLIAATGHRPDA